MATASRNYGSYNWRAQLGARLIQANEAAAHIKSGDRVCLSIAQATPFMMCTALAARLMEIDNVIVYHSAAAFDWDLPGLGERFRLESHYVGPYDRQIYAQGRADFTPVSYFRDGHLPPSMEHFNVYIMTVSPPDEAGYLNFGDLQIMSKLLARNSDLVIAEIAPNSIRVGGDNQIHISDVHWFVERDVAPPEITLPKPSEEEQKHIDTVCAMVAGELVPDRATLQIGVGSISGAVMPISPNITTSGCKPRSFLIIRHRWCATAC
jgi:4-hydroxybutyrate CoA-transferase